MTLLMFLYALRKISLSVAAVGEETSGGDNQEAGHEDTAETEAWRLSPRADVLHGTQFPWQTGQGPDRYCPDPSHRLPAKASTTPIPSLVLCTVANHRWALL